LMDVGKWQELEIGLVNRTIYLVTANGRWGGGTQCTLRKGEIK
jgi:hypothetical protein